MTQYVAYYRVSTKKQGIGLEAQKRLVEHFAKATINSKGEEGEDGIVHGVIVAEFSEKRSGKSIDNRPELAKAINMCNEFGYTLIVAKTDRLSRDMNHATGLAKLLDNRLYCLDCPEPEMLGLFFFLAERELKIIRLRTKQGLDIVKLRTPEQRKALNKKTIGKPKGHSNEKATNASIEARKEKRNIFLTEAYTHAIYQRNTEGKTLQQTADYLNDVAKLTTTRGKRFTPQTVKSMLDTVVPVDDSMRLSKQIAKLPS